MVIKKQYEEYCQTQKKILTKIQKFSVLISLIYLIVVINYILFIRTKLPETQSPTASYPYISHYKPSSFVLLCDIYLIIVGVVNSLIFKYEKKRKQELEESLGEVIDYEKYYLEIFKILNFGILVTGVIRLFQEGLYQWAYQIGILGYCVVQLVLADAMTNVQAKILRAETDLDEGREDQIVSDVV